MCPMPGVANSTMKWPSFSDRLWAIFLRALSCIPERFPCKAARLGAARIRPGYGWAGLWLSRSGFLRPGADEGVFDDGLVLDVGRAGAVERREMCGLAMGVEGGAVVVDLDRKSKRLNS